MHINFDTVGDHDVYGHRALNADDIPSEVLTKARAQVQCCMDYYANTSHARRARQKLLTLAKSWEGAQ